MSKIKIALDDGHGSNTPGKRTPPIPGLGGKVIHENDFNSAVVERLDYLLKQNGNFETVLTAPTKADTSLSQRCAVANKFGAKAFISVHANALDSKFDGESKDPSGIETWYMSEKGKKLANCVHQQLVKGTPQKDRGLKKSTGLYVLKNTDMPAILTENCFMDNEREAMLMNDKNFIYEVAYEHYVGICNYFKIDHTKVVKPTKPTVAPAPTIKPSVNPNLKSIKYRVRKSATDMMSQKGAYTDLQNAKKCADANPGYKVYDLNGKVVYGGKTSSYLVEISVGILNVRAQPNTSSKVTATVRRGGMYTIVDEQNGWGKLKSGAGWIYLTYTKKK